MKVRNMDVGRVWDGMMCTCVNEEGGDGEGVFSEPSSLLSYTLRYVNLAELGHVCQFGPRSLCISNGMHKFSMLAAILP